LKALLLGIGNILLSDEGAGVRALEEFGRRYEVPDSVRLLDGGTGGIELLYYFENCETLIVFDAIRAASPPGTLLTLEGEQVPTFFQKKISPHQLGLSDLLAAAMLTGELPQKVVLFGIEPGSMDTGLSLSEEVQKNIPEMARLAAIKLQRMGIHVRERINGGEE
jgi:hydrogenase maturation protease